MSTAKTFRKKPVEIQAAQWQEPGDHAEVGYWRYPPIDPDTGEISAADNAISLGKLRHCDAPSKFRRPECAAVMDDHGWIDTLEGGHTVCPGDWVIRGVRGEFYPCKPDIFAATYDEVVGGAA
ncbi:hypothetical protein ACWEOE_31655 [Amycolatopsis sp. NPDC004368]